MMISMAMYLGDEVMSISINKKYRTRSGLPVRILCDDLIHPFYKAAFVATEKNGQDLVLKCNAAGHHSDQYIGPLHDLDLIEISKYDDFIQNEMVIVVRDHDEFRAHFATHEFLGSQRIDTPFIYASGRTSWSRACIADSMLPVDGVRRPTQEELNKWANNEKIGE